MNNPDTDWIKPGVQAAMHGHIRLFNPISGIAQMQLPDGQNIFMIEEYLRPLPPPLSPTAQRVVEAAMAEEQALTIFRAGGGGERGLPRLRAVWELTQSQTSAAVAEHLATLRPADPLAVAMEALRGHDEMMRGNYGDPENTILPLAHAENWKHIRAAILLIERGGKGEG